MSVALGPYHLIERLGAGGSGEVWRAQDTRQDEAVAIKVFHPSKAPGPSALERELRAVGGLCHPHIVRILDAGGGDGAQPAWLAMELVPGPTLAAAIGQTLWPDLLDQLTILCDALAHAHARGVLHRDLKPANVLGQGLGIRLADFGIAAIAGEQPRAAGTLGVMAPEQFGGDHHQGPWTDLYGLGALVWTMVCGRGPYGALADWDEAATAHARWPLPRLRPAIEVPAGLEGLLARLLAKDPSKRPDRASDVKAALLALPTLLPTRQGRLPPPDLLEETREQPATVGPFIAAPSPSPLGPHLRPRTAPLARPVAGPLHALQLVPLRAPALVGREAEQLLLWDRLSAVTKAERPAAVWLTGPPGAGKSSLARWLSQAAHEVGAADTLVLVHGPMGGPSDGLPGALSRHFGIHDADPDQRQRRLDDLGPLAPTVAPLVADPQTRPMDPAERQERVQELLQALCSRRPLLLVVEDAPWAAASLAQLRPLLSARLPLLLLITAPAPSPDWPGDTLQLGPIDAPTLSGLVDQLLPLQSADRDRLVSIAAGSPLLAQELLSAWIDAGALGQGPGGRWRVDPTAARLPLDLPALWRGRLDRFCEGRARAERCALRGAAALGVEVDPAEWSAVAAVLGLPNTGGLLQALESARLARPAPDGRWSFVHNTLREEVLQSADAADRTHVHQACVAVLERSMGLARQPERVAAHLEAAGDPRAADVWLRAAEDAVIQSRFDDAKELLARAETAHNLFPSVNSDIDWRVRAESIDVASLLARTEAIGLAEKHLRRALLTPSPHATAFIGVLLSRAYIRVRRFTDLDTIIKHTRNALTSLPVPDLRLDGQLSWSEAILHTHQGNPRAALDALTRGEATFLSIGMRIGVVFNLATQSQMLAHQGNTVEARKTASQALLMAEQEHLPMGIAIAHNSFAEVWAMEGDFVRAIKHLDLAKNVPLRNQSLHNHQWLTRTAYLLAQGDSPAAVGALRQYEALHRGHPPPRDVDLYPLIAQLVEIENQEPPLPNHKQCARLDALRERCAKDPFSYLISTPLLRAIEARWRGDHTHAR